MKKKFEKDQKVMARSRLFGSLPPVKKSESPMISESNDQDELTVLRNLHCGPLSSKLKIYEDKHLGKFTRIFPPENEDLLNSYLNLLLYLNSLTCSQNNETVATKARKEYLISKKSATDLKIVQYQEWKKRRGNLKTSSSESKPRSFSLDSVLQNKQSQIKPRLSVSSGTKTQKSEIELRIQTITYPTRA